MIEPLADPDAMEVAAMLRQDDATLSAEAPVPAAGLVWWRSTIRARAEAARIAERPIALAQTLAVAFVIALAFGSSAAAWRLAPELILQHAIALVCVVAVCLLLAPIAVFVALGN